MRIVGCSTLLLSLFLTGSSAHDAAVCVTDAASPIAPMVPALLMKNGNVIEASGDANGNAVNVMGCCGTCADDSSLYTPQVIGTMPQMTEKQAMEVLEAAKEAWNGGFGVWPQMSLGERITAIENFLVELRSSRDEIIEILMWEIGKNKPDATAEFDRTVQFIETMISEIQTDPEFNSDWQTIGATRAFVRRTAIGIIMCLGPYNYPLNETWAMAFAALLAGNVLVLKIPTVGGLCHLLTMDAFSKTLPPGTIHFISGSGRTTMPPLMKSGFIDGLGFIGGSKAADDLIRQHPHPHRLKLFLQLEAKNMGIFLPDVFKDSNMPLLEASLSEAITGTLSYNGQRCTALKLLFVPREHADRFVEKFISKVDAMSVGLPWHTFEDGEFSKITPLPNQGRISYMRKLIDDAISKGAKIVNKNGGTILGGADSTLMVPAVLYPVTKDMDVYHQEQFGPVVPIVPYDDLSPILEYGRVGDYGQQVSMFTSGQSAETVAAMLDKFSAVFGKININSQCGRSPDTLPFSGRRSSAMGVMSARYAIREFSVPTVVAHKNEAFATHVVDQIQTSSKFMEKLA